MLFALYNRALANLLNHLLDQTPWARISLAQYAGKSVAVHLFPVRMQLEIGHEGRLRHSSALTADATIRLQPLQALRIALHDTAVNREIEIGGDLQLAACFGNMLRGLKWDAEADLAHFAGDSVAHWLIQALQGFKDWQSTNLSETASTFMEYATEESPILAKRQHIMNFIADVDTLRDSQARLQKRLELIAQSVSAR